jgi:hypothetical protein
MQSAEHPFRVRVRHPGIGPEQAVVQRASQLGVWQPRRGEQPRVGLSVGSGVQVTRRIVGRQVRGYLQRLRAAGPPRGEQPIDQRRPDFCVEPQAYGRRRAPKPGVRVLDREQRPGKVEQDAFLTAHGSEVLDRCVHCNFPI